MDAGHGRDPSGAGSGAGGGAPDGGPFGGHGALPRRRLLAWAGLAAAAGRAAPAGALPARALSFPRDRGAHNDFRTEWWYVTGQASSTPPGAAPADARRFGFQLTFFRSRVEAAQALRSRFAARQLVFAHAAVTDLRSGRLLHDQRIARWSGRPREGEAWASEEDTAVALGDWSLVRAPDGAYRARLPAEGFALALDFRETQPPLLQGDAGLSRKGPDAAQASYYYSLPQLAVAGSLTVGGTRFPVDAAGTVAALADRPAAWFDHEWSQELLHPEAEGWDWAGINLFDGSALTLFRLRRRDGSALWAGGSLRAAGGAPRAFGPQEVAFAPLRRWTSGRTGVAYPVAWRVRCPAGEFLLEALQDDQELDSRASTGAVYWEGLSALRDTAGHPIGRGYLEMTGYAGPLRL
ncbi:MAG: carotenoid 1,2-hydratase [Xylophilus ampelinus]